MNNSIDQHKAGNKKYWKSLEDRNGLELPVLNNSSEDQFQLNRRTFLESVGFAATLSMLSGCDDLRAPVERAYPFVKHPEGVTPGKMRYFASTCSGCTAECGLLVGVRDGRPLKMEGMPEHPLSQGGLCAVGQALPLELYDRKMFSNPMMNNKEESWKTIDQEIKKDLEKLKESNGPVRFVSNTISSPTLKDGIKKFLEQFPDAKHITFDSYSHSAILDAHLQSHGVRILPHYRIDKAKVIVSLDADFLGTWISPVEFTAGWVKGRKLPYQENRKVDHDSNDHDGRNHSGKDRHEKKSDENHKENEEREVQVKEHQHSEMSYHVQFESRMTLTGANSDNRYVINPDEQGLILSSLFVQLAKMAGKKIPEIRIKESAIPDSIIENISKQLWKNKEHSLVISGSQEVRIQLLVNQINALLDNYGTTLDIVNPSQQAEGNDQDVIKLVSEIKDEKIKGLFVLGVDLFQNLPVNEELDKKIASIPLLVSFAERNNKTTAFADYICPDLHSLESWKDAEPVSGLYSLYQPVIPKLRNTRSVLESLAIWSGKPATALNLIRSYWKKSVFPLQDTEKTFVRFWDKAVHDGFVKLKHQAEEPKLIDSSIKLVTRKPAGDQLSLVLYQKVAFPDSRHAQNPWLQELPDPVTKVTWDNYVSLSPVLADKFNIENGDIVQITTENSKVVQLPAFIQPGQQEKTVAIALGYGVPGTERFKKVGPQWLEARPTLGANGLVGVNAAPLLEFIDNQISFLIRNVKLEKMNGHRFLATTQLYDSIEIPENIPLKGGEKREVVQETTLKEYQQDPLSGAPDSHHHADEQLWPEDHPQEGHKWGMVIDLNSCTGCSACLIACQSENNVPVVGRDEVYRHREMHWIRIDRYYSGDEKEPEVTHQPMMCHHCDNAPCETVCPVLATVHSEEGLNQQVYNRCVGTRYCANNCPYKVRRFNWFDYSHNDTLENLALNPDVTVRMRGIMEKCSFCVQRIQEGKIEAGNEGVPLSDGEIQTACQQSCPAGAIVFGDLNNQESKACIASHDTRAYSVLEELNIRPSVSYLRQVRNKTEDESRD